MSGLSGRDSGPFRDLRDVPSAPRMGHLGEEQRYYLDNREDALIMWKTVEGES